jgi:hypothetical protein
VDKPPPHPMWDPLISYRDWCYYWGQSSSERPTPLDWKPEPAPLGPPRPEGQRCPDCGRWDHRELTREDKPGPYQWDAPRIWLCLACGTKRPATGTPLVCAWCGVHLGGDDPKPGEKISSGMCRICLANMDRRAEEDTRGDA